MFSEIEFDVSKHFYLFGKKVSISKEGWGPVYLDSGSCRKKCPHKCQWNTKENPSSFKSVRKDLYYEKDYTIDFRWKGKATKF